MESRGEHSSIRYQDLCSGSVFHVTCTSTPLRMLTISMLVQAHYWTGYMALWLRWAGYSIELVNILPTFIDLLRALSSWLGTTLAGCLSLRGLWTFQAVSRQGYFKSLMSVLCPICYCCFGHLDSTRRFEVLRLLLWRFQRYGLANLVFVCQQSIEGELWRTWM